jgi:hypothetical protein
MRCFDPLLATAPRALLFAFMLCACGEDDPSDQAFGVVDPTGFPDAGLGSLSPVYGFHEGRRAEGDAERRR